MLAGLLFLGVIAASAMPDIMASLRGSAADDDGPEDAAPDETGIEGQIALGDLLGDHSEVGQEDPAGSGEGIDLFADSIPGITQVSAFQPGSDTLTIAVPDSAGGFAVSSDAEGEFASLTYEIADGVVEVRFTGLGDVPVDDIFLRVTDVSSPSGDADIALGVVLQPDFGEGEGDPLVLLPENPEEPDAPNPGPGGGDDLALSPVDPEEPDIVGDETLVTGPVLLPVMDDIAPEPGVAESGLSVLGPEDDGSAGPVDPAVSDGPEVAVLFPEGEEGAAETQGADGISDVFWLYPPVGSDAIEVAEVSNFTPGEDILRISLDGGAGTGAGLVSVTGSDDGLDGLVQIDGVTVAILRGAPGVSMGDIYVETRPELFA
jgi:hypothetical protein